MIQLPEFYCQNDREKSFALKEENVSSDLSRLHFHMKAGFLDQAENLDN